MILYHQHNNYVPLEFLQKDVTQWKEFGSFNNIKTTAAYEFL